MSVTALDHVQVAGPRGCEDDARRFYGDALGLEEIEKPPALRARGGVWFRVGAQELHVGIEEPFTPATKAHPAFRVADLDAARARLDAAGATIVEDDGTIPGVRRLYTADPFGNRIELVSR